MTAKLHLKWVEYLGQAGIFILILWAFGGYLNAQVTHWQWLSPKQLLTTLVTNTATWQATDLPTIGSITQSDAGLVVTASRATSSDYFLFGPYVPIVEGYYHLRIEGFSFDKTDTEIVSFEIAARQGAEILYTTTLKANQLPFEVDLDLPSTLDLEFRFRALSDESISIQQITLARQDIRWWSVVRSLPTWIADTVRGFPKVNPF